MKSWKFKYLIAIFFILSLMLGLNGCVTTKPNISIIDKNHKPSRNQQHDTNYFKVKSILTWLTVENRLLAVELGKLPEFQDSVSSTELRGLENIVELYENNKDVFDKSFGNMLQIGDPEVRKYCSPLQALFWLAEKKEADQLGSLIHTCSLENLLRESWGSALTLNEMRTIINGIKDNSSKDWYLKQIVKGEFQSNEGKQKLCHWILNYYKSKPEMFTEEARALIEEDVKNNARWTDFDGVVERLNAPELVHYFIAREFKYLRGKNQTPSDTFKRKTGQCISLANFGAYCLKKAGYNTFIRSVKFGPDPNRDDHTGSGVILDDGRYLLVVDFPRKKGLRVFDDVSSLDTALGSSTGKICDRMWGHKNGPWY